MNWRLVLPTRRFVYIHQNHRQAAFLQPPLEALLAALEAVLQQRTV